ncbi:hypothetical protein D3C81_1555900 [compost metagenome]
MFIAQGQGFFRTHHQQHVLIGLQAGGESDRQRLPLEGRHRITLGLELEEVRVAEERGDKGVRRILVQVITTAEADDLAVTENRDALGQTHGFFLIVGHVDDGDAQAPMQLTQFILQVFAQFFVQCTEGFVHQQNAWFVNQRAGDSDSLLLATGELRRAAMGKLLKLHQLEHRIDPALAFGGGQFADGQRKGDVVAHRQVREQ